MKKNIYSAEALLALAKQYGAQWEQNESVDWEQAEELAQACSKLEPASLSCNPEIQSIVTYTQSEDEWDCNIVGNWIDTIIRSLS